MQDSFFKKFQEGLMKNFFAGLAVILPLALTIYFSIIAFNALDKILGNILRSYLEDGYIKGIGVIVLLSLIWLTGMLARNIFVKRAINVYEGIFSKIPLLGNVFNALKEISSSLFAGDKNTFRDVVLIKSPTFGMNRFGFVTSATTVNVEKDGVMVPAVHVYVPFTPPTQGIIAVIPVEDLSYLDITVEQGLKSVASFGMVHPESYPVKKK